jgi:hypothetical protein
MPAQMTHAAMTVTASIMDHSNPWASDQFQAVFPDSGTNIHIFIVKKIAFIKPLL